MNMATQLTVTTYLLSSQLTLGTSSTTRIHIVYTFCIGQQNKKGVKFTIDVVAGGTNHLGQIYIGQLRAFFGPRVLAIHNRRERGVGVPRNGLLPMPLTRCVQIHTPCQRWVCCPPRWLVRATGGGGVKSSPAANPPPPPTICQKFGGGGFWRWRGGRGEPAPQVQGHRTGPLLGCL